MKDLVRRAEALARSAEERAKRRIAREMGGARGLRVTIEAAGVVIEGRGLMRRWLSEAGLRFAGRQK